MVSHTGSSSVLLGPLPKPSGGDVAPPLLPGGAYVLPAGPPTLLTGTDGSAVNSWRGWGKGGKHRLEQGMLGRRRQAGGRSGGGSGASGAAGAQVGLAIAEAQFRPQLQPAVPHAERPAAQSKAPASAHPLHVVPSCTADRQEGPHGSWLLPAASGCGPGAGAGREGRGGGGWAVLKDRLH